MIDQYNLFGILGLIAIITGTFLMSEDKKIKRKIIYPFLLLGGIFLLIYSVYKNDLIFIILQSAYTLIVIYNIIKLKK